MASRPDYYVISYDAGEALPYGFAWFVNLGVDTRGGSGFTFFATREEAVAFAGNHTRFTNPVLLVDDEVAA